MPAAAQRGGGQGIPGPVGPYRWRAQRLGEVPAAAVIGQHHLCPRQEGRQFPQPQPAGQRRHAAGACPGGGPGSRPDGGSHHVVRQPGLAPVTDHQNLAAAVGPFPGDGPETGGRPRNGRSASDGGDRSPRDGSPAAESLPAAGRYLESFADTALSAEELVQQMEVHRSQGQSIVLTNGCFDVLHSGHTRYLNQARELGDVLVAALYSDQSVRKLKGPGRPINAEADRAAVIAALSCVDYVTVLIPLRPFR